MEGPISESQPVRRPIVVAIVVSALFMSSLDSTIVATALHTVQVELNASIAWVGWVITGYSLGMVVALPLSGRLADRIGRRRTFIASVALFGIASLLCGLASNIYMLVAFRVLQAIGGAGFTPSATGIVVEHFGHARDRALGLFGSIFPIGAMTGPVLGGLIVGYLSWRDVFFVNVPVAALMIPLALRFIPRDREPEHAGTKAHWDLTGSALMVLGLVSVMLGLTIFDGAPDTGVVWLAVLAPLGVLSLGLLFRHIRRVPDPIVSPGLVYGRGFGAVNIVNVIYGGGLSAMMALVPLYATTRYGISVLGSGTLLVAQSIAAIVGSVAASAALRRMGYRAPIYTGAVLMVIGVFGLAVPPPVGTPYVWLAMCAAVIGAGAGWSSPATRNAGLQMIPDQAGALASLRTIGRQFGQISMISVTTVVIGLSADMPSAHAAMYLAFAILLVVAIPVIHRVPEHRGAW
jgi:EmrB/QacA subfamily drug resistance transporter